MGNKDQVQFEDDDVDTLDSLDDDIDLDDPVDDTLSAAEKIDAAEQARVDARHEIERRNELKALKSELDEWDDLFDEDIL